jgi:ADP-heptose:LPS heptosyltransferase
VVFVGPDKNFELFNGDPRIRHLPLPYSRSGTLVERLKASLQLQYLLDRPDAIVIDPDSRLTQLGLIPVCDDSRYYFFESRSYGAHNLLPLSILTSHWMSQIFGASARPYIAPASAPAASGKDNVCISLGVGNNNAKRVPDTFECELLKGITERGCPVLIDYGAGDDETQRVDRAIAGAGAERETIRTWRGAFAAFAAAIGQSRLYVGYDSSGQHVAAACGVPLVMVSAGAPNSRFQARWRPAGSGPIEIIHADSKDVIRILSETLQAVDRMLQVSPHATEPRWPAERLTVRA